MRTKVLLCVLALLTTVAHARRPPPEPVRFYDGPGRPLADIASVGTDVNDIRIVSIDNREVAAKENMGVHVLPGEHDFTFLSSRKLDWQFREVSSQTLRLAVEPGHSYVPLAIFDPETKRMKYELRDAGRNYDQACLVPDYPDHSGTRKRAAGCL